MKRLVSLAAIASMLGCAHMTPYEHKLVDCGTAAVQAQLPTLITEVAPILTGNSPNWQSDLDNLIAAAGPAAICAIQATIDQLTGKPAEMAPGAQKAAVRGYLYMETHGYVTR